MTDKILIEPLNIAGATFLLQFCILAVLMIGITMLNSARSAIDISNQIDRKKSAPPIPLTSIGWCFILTFPALLLSESFSYVWGPLFQGIRLPTFGTHAAVFFVFIVNLIVVTYLIFVSGGVQDSPFTAVLFMLPALAIFLRLQAYVFLFCAAYAALAYLLVLYWCNSELRLSAKHANAVVNSLCLGLTALIGFVTRPVPII